MATLQDLLNLQEEQLNNQKTYADSLRDRRANYSQFAETVKPRFDNSQGQVDPNTNFNLLNALFQAGQNYVEPAATAEEQYGNLLQQLIENTASTQPQVKEPTYSERLAAMKEGYDIKDGQFVPLNTNDAQNIISKVEDKTARGKAAEYVAFMKDIKDVRDKISGLGLVSDVTTGQTGPLSQFLGQYGQGGDVRTQIDKLNANVKNKTYGAAVSEGELKDANKWLPSSARQETQNAKRLDAIFNSKKNELTSLLRGQGLSDQEIKTYLDIMLVGENQPANADPLGLGL